MLSAQQSTPVNPDAKRSWGIAQMYIEENSADLAIDELKKVISNESFAPAYLKLIELCYQSGNENLISDAKDYTEEFISLWPARENEIKDLVATCEAKGKLRRTKFLEALIGNWHLENYYTGDDYLCFKIRRSGEGFQLILPQRMWDWEVVTDWQDGVLSKNFNDNGIVLYETGYGKTYEGYRVKNDTENGTYWIYVYLEIPYYQPELSKGKIRIKGDVRTTGPNNFNYSSKLEQTLVKD